MVDRWEERKGERGEERGEADHISLMLAAARRALPGAPSMADCSTCATQYLVLDVLLSQSTANLT